MKILGLSIGELSTACLMIDGKVVACASEERFSRKKNEMRYPEVSIAYCLDKAGILSTDLDLITVASVHHRGDYQATKKFSSFSIGDYVREQNEYFYPVMYKGEDIKWIDVFRDKIHSNQYPGGFDKLDYSTEKPFIDLLHRGIKDQLGEVSIIHLDHHSCHAYYAYHASPFRGKPCLVFTMDGYGDGLTASINIVENDHIMRIANSEDCSIGRLYRYITLLLGMKPNEHEYKVMGLAPYAKPDVINHPYQVFKKGMYVDGIGFKFHEKPPDLYFYYKKELEGCRFDGIAGALQKYTEEIITEWVRNATKKTGIRRIVFTGGVSMNVKAMKGIAELPEVDEFFVCPSGGDESMAIGSCYIGNGGGKPLDDVYLGPEFSNRFIETLIKKEHLEDKYDITRNISAFKLAYLISEGSVIGRCVGRMEFGARALGNRSILADPRDPAMVRKINDKIKSRDFWMPFAPSILAEREKDYIINPKNLSSPYMTLAFDSTDKARKEIPAALHPADYTMRPQIVTKESNPEYHALIREFEKITDVGALLNTSFNLHGHPIICNPRDALGVMENSGIDGIVLNDILIMRRVNK